ncbi:carbohydrate ABC transporter permease [Natronospirillum operosum]|uniref:Carbohydrate ABC transporter permease n=1 Tax=Natronospirillum operosum TaxID=2759953 RepID=A0A4Z0WD01_9GAMM|nr:carbohydrate ABC transporter permease [Natronospirillum operosum]TGG91654.1 carbohydrate ABC transporter permease [Natronospirillum operosum]
MTVKHSNRRYSEITGRAVLYAILIIVAIYYLIPLVIMISTSFRDMNDIRFGHLIDLPSSFSFEAWRMAWSEVQIGARRQLGLRPYFINSLLITIPAVTISVILGAVNGYVLSFWRFKGSNIFFALLLFGCFLPFQAILLPQATVLGKIGLSGTIPGLVLTHVVYGVAFTTLFYRNYYVSLPGELVKAAQLDGAGFWRIFWRIILPLSTPITVVAVIWQFTQIWNDFLFGVAFSSPQSQPVTVGLNNMVNSSTGEVRYNVDMAGAIIAALPTLAVYVIAGKYFVRGLTAGSVKG